MNEEIVERANWSVLEHDLMESLESQKKTAKENLKILRRFTTCVSVDESSNTALLKNMMKQTNKHIRVATLYLERLTSHKNTLFERIQQQKLRVKVPQVLCLTLDKCPEVISNRVMEYLPPLVRLINLRQKYTDDYLIAGLLSNRTVKDLIFINNKYCFEVWMTCSHLDMDGVMCQKVGDVYTFDDHGEAFDQDTMTDVEIAEHTVKWFSRVIEEEYIYKTMYEPYLCDFVCKRAIQLLLMLVTIINN